VVRYISHNLTVLLLLLSYVFVQNFMKLNAAVKSYRANRETNKNLRGDAENDAAIATADGKDYHRWTWYYCFCLHIVFSYSLKRTEMKIRPYFV